LINAENWYDNNPDAKYFYQGDVIRDIPYAFWPNVNSEKEQTKWGLLRPYNEPTRTTTDVLKALPTLLVGRAAKSVTDAWVGGREYVVAACEKLKVMILTRSCTLDHPGKKHCVVAPITSFKDLPEAQQRADILEDLRKNNIPHKFFLPAKGELEESFADFTKIVPIHRSFLDDKTIPGQLVVRLSSIGTIALQRMLSNHFGTKFGFDHKDECPQTGTYSCSSCFHLGMHVFIKKFDAGLPFGSCDQCGELAMWVKIPS
jgi:hypothetical protein